MNAIFQFIIRQSSCLAFLLLLLAVGNGWYVSEGLWQGSGLHGRTCNFNPKYGGFFIIWTWDAFVRMLVFLGLAVLFQLVALVQKKEVGLRFNSGRIGIDKVDVTEVPDTQRVSWTNRRRAKRHW